MNVVVIGNQNLLDIATQEDGTILAAFNWAVANGIAVTDLLTPGQTLINPNSQFRNVDVANFFKSKKQMIATASDNIDNTIEVPGIGAMIIETNFQVA